MRKVYVIIDYSTDRYNNLFYPAVFKTRDKAINFIDELQHKEEDEYGYLLRTACLKVFELEVI